MEGDGEKGTVCVTGGTGYVASWLIKKLLEHGYRVRTTVRSYPDNNKDLSFLTNLPGASQNLQIYGADLSQSESFDPVIRGCTGVFHVAHPIDFENMEPEEVKTKRAINATVAILKSSLHSKTVKRVVYTSSASAVMFSSEGLDVVDENHWSDPDIIRKISTFGISYMVSKTLTEQAALDFAKKNGIDFVSVIPVFINGPFVCPRVPGSVYTSLSMIFGDGRHYEHLTKVQMVHVDDVASAHIFLFEYPDAKGRYNCSAVDVTSYQISEFLSAKYLQYPIPTPEVLKSWQRFLRINLPAGCHPTGVAFSDDASSLVVACQALVGSSLYMYGADKPKAVADSKQPPKLPLPEIKWAHHKVHDRKNIISLFGTKATYGSADGSTILASSSEGTDIIIWHGKAGKILGNVDTNQLKNNMAVISPNGHFVAAAAFTADVKVWEIVYSKDSSVKEVSRVMQLKGHKTAVTWLCFSPNSEQIITASKDGTLRIWNINVRYHLDEDPKTLKVFPIPLHDSKGTTLHYDRLSISPDGRILAATHGSTLQWLSVESGEVLETAEKAHDGDFLAIEWAPIPILMGDKKALILATASTDKKVKLWATPPL